MLPARFSNRPPNPNGGVIIFGLQLLLVILVPILDDGRALAPLVYVGVLIACLATTVSLLGYGRTAATIAVVGGVAVALVVLAGRLVGPVRLVLWATLISAGAVTVTLTLKSAFAAGVPAVQRIFCGAAGYVIQSGVERMRPIHWSDYVWLSFATLTTSGFGDVVSVGSVPSAVSTLEALAGILFPATLIARIASLADAGRRT